MLFLLLVALHSHTFTSKLNSLAQDHGIVAKDPGSQPLESAATGRGAKQGYISPAAKERCYSQSALRRLTAGPQA